MSSAMLKGVRFDNKGLRSGHRGIAALICCLMFFLEESLGDSSFVLFVCGRCVIFFNHNRSIQLRWCLLMRRFVLLFVCL